MEGQTSRKGPLDSDKVKKQCKSINQRYQQRKTGGCSEARSDHDIPADIICIDLAFQVFAIIPISDGNRIVRQALYIISWFGERAWDICVRPQSFIPGLGRPPEEGMHGKPLQDSCLENPMDIGTQQVTACRVTESQTQLK